MLAIVLDPTASFPLFQILFPPDTFNVLKLPMICLLLIYPITLRDNGDTELLGC